MKNSYLIAGLIVLIVALGLIFASRKTEAPQQEVADQESNTQTTVGTFTDGTYKLNPSASTLYWEGEFVTGMSEKGSVGLASGNFKVTNGIISSGEFVIDLNTIDSEPRKEKLVTHLKSDDFFSVATYPTATFTLKSMTATSEEGAKAGRYVIGGDLTVKGITKPISFTATFGTAENKLSATASFAINRADWEIKYNSATFFQNLGDKIIRDAVVIGLDLQGERVLE